MPGAFTIPLWEVLDIEGDTGNGFRIGLNDYPIWKPEYRDPLNRKILRHYWNREIAHESIPMFTFALQRKMWEIMPLYNQVYLSTEMEFDPFSTVNLATERDDTGSESGKLDSATAATAGTNSASRTVNSDTPQTQLSGDEDYATAATDATGATTSTNSGTQSNTTSSTNTLSGKSTTSGYQGALADLLLKYRATLLNTDMLVVNELPELFMGVWDNGLEILPKHSIGWTY